MSENTPESIPATLFDTKIARARGEEGKHDAAIARARDVRGRALAEARELRRRAGERGVPVKKSELEKLEAIAEAAAADYRRADQLRLRARARATALEAARERYLLQYHNIFPPRRAYRDAVHA